MKKDIRLYFFVAFILLAILACSTNNTGNNEGKNANGGGELFLEDDFSDEESGWINFDEPEYSTAYEDGGYLISVFEEEFYFVNATGFTFTDVIVEADATFVDGEIDNYFGLVCRYIDINNFYGLVISADGYYAILKSYDEEAGVIGAEDFLASDLINQGEEENHLRIECIGNRLALYVNGELLIETYDSDIPEGDVGFFVGTATATSTEILFDNLKVFEP